MGTAGHPQRRHGKGPDAGAAARVIVQPMKIATWNVNSLRVRLPQVIEWLSLEEPDVLCLQETKLTDADFPAQAIADAGYRVAFAGQKTYNGVATLARDELSEVVTDLPGMDDPQRRLLAAEVSGLRVLNVYVPNGQEVGSEKFAYKLQWLDTLVSYVRAELARYPELVLVGDFNIAPRDEDVHDPDLWRGQVLCSDPERSRFQGLVDCGLEDSFRKFDQDPGTFTWWDYRAAAFRRNLGLRIDHVLVSRALSLRCSACRVDKTPRKWERPSDHAPVVAEFS